MSKKITLIVFLLSFSSQIFADTIWCKALKVGCVTEEQKLKQAQHCEQMANESYREGLNEALADPTIWQFAGMTSAQDYANMRKRSMRATCFKMTTPHNY